VGVVLNALVVAAGVALVLVLVRTARRLEVQDRVAALAPRRRRLPRALEARLDAALAAADLRCDASTALGWWALVVVLGGALGMVVAPALAVLGGVGAVVGGPAYLVLARGRGRQRVAAAVPDVLERCAMELRSGGTVATAVAAVAANEGPLRRDFARVQERFALGASLDDALAHWARERDVPGVRAAAGALALGASVGGAGASALDGLAASLRARLGVIAETRALSAQARLSAIVVGSAPVGYLAWSAVIDPGPLQSLFATTAGRVCVVVAVLLEAAGCAWMRRILGEEAAWA
jgi:tight adherence protein B